MTNNIGQINRSILYILISGLATIGLAGTAIDTQLSQEDKKIARILKTINDFKASLAGGPIDEILSENESTFEDEIYYEVGKTLSLSRKFYRLRHRILDDNPISLEEVTRNKKLREFLVQVANKNHYVGMHLNDLIVTMKQYLILKSADKSKHLLAWARLIKVMQHIYAPNTQVVYFAMLMVKDFGHMIQIKSLQKIKRLLLSYIAEADKYNEQENRYEPINDVQLTQNDTNKILDRALVDIKRLKIHAPLWSRFSRCTFYQYDSSLVSIVESKGFAKKKKLLIACIDELIEEVKNMKPIITVV
jgi:hypothetical protein